MEIGINTNNQSGKDDIEILNNLAKTGFKNIMLSFKTKNHDQILKTIQDLKLKISFFHINNQYANDLWSMGEAVNKYIEDVSMQLEFCGKNNISIAIMHATCGSPTDFAFKPNKNGLDNFKKILNVAKKNGVKIALENVDCFGIKHLLYLLDNIQDDSLGFCYDVGHHHLYNLKKDLIKKYKNRLLAIHLHDNLMDWKIGYDYTRDLHLLPFDGKINFDNVCKKLKKHGYSGVVMLEIHKTTSGKPQKYKEFDNLEYLKEAYSRAKKLLKMIN